jgi:hypothetical protein
LQPSDLAEMDSLLDAERYAEATAED